MLTAAGLQVIFAAVGACGLENAPSSAGPPLGVTPEVVSPGTAGTPGTEETLGTWSAPGRSPSCGPLGRSMVACAADADASTTRTAIAASNARRKPVFDADP